MKYNVNALLAIWITGLIAIYWIMAAQFEWAEAGEVKGATIAAFMLIVQFFFRKKPPNEAK